MPSDMKEAYGMWREVMKMNCDAFRRKVNVMLTYTGITKKRVAEKLGVPSNSFNAELFNCISGKKQERIIDAIYDLSLIHI